MCVKSAKQIRFTNRTSIDSSQRKLTQQSRRGKTPLVSTPQRVYLFLSYAFIMISIADAGIAGCAPLLSILRQSFGSLVEMHDA